MHRLLALLLLLPIAAAGPAPVVHYLDSESQFGEGVLDAQAPEGNESKYGVILASEGPATWFEGDAQTDRIAGPMFMGIWRDVQLAEGNITATVEVRGGDEAIVSTASYAVAINPTPPDPTSLIPPDPTDPEGAAFYIASQAMAAIANPPVLLDFGYVDIQVPENGSIAVGLHIDGSGIATLKYDATPTPSFLYVPWYEADPPAADPAATDPPATDEPDDADEPEAPSSPSNPDAGSSADSDAEEPSGKDSPGLGLVALLAAVALVGYLRRQS